MLRKSDEVGEKRSLSPSEPGAASSGATASIHATLLGQSLDPRAFTSASSATRSAKAGGRRCSISAWESESDSASVDSDEEVAAVTQSIVVGHRYASLSDAYEWTLFVQALDPDTTWIGDVVAKVVVTLPQSYAPYHKISLTTPPFELTRCDSESFPVSIAIHTWDRRTHVVSHTLLFRGPAEVCRTFHVTSNGFEEAPRGGSGTLVKTSSGTMVQRITESERDRIKRDAVVRLEEEYRRKVTERLAQQVAADPTFAQAAEGRLRRDFASIVQEVIAASREATASSSGSKEEEVEGGEGKGTSVEGTAPSAATQQSPADNKRSSATVKGLRGLKRAMLRIKALKTQQTDDTDVVERRRTLARSAITQWRESVSMSKGSGVALTPPPLPPRTARPNDTPLDQGTPAAKVVEPNAASSRSSLKGSLKVKIRSLWRRPQVPKKGFEISPPIPDSFRHVANVGLNDAVDPPTLEDDGDTTSSEVKPSLQPGSVSNSVEHGDANVAVADADEDAVSEQQQQQQQEQEQQKQQDLQKQQKQQLQHALTLQSEYEAEIAALKASNAEVRKHLDATQAQLSQVSAQCADLQLQLTKARSDLAAREQLAAEAHSRAVSAEEALAVAQQRLADTNGVPGACVEAVASDQPQLSSTDVDDVIRQLRAQLSQAAADHEAKVTLMQQHHEAQVQALKVDHEATLASQHARLRAEHEAAVEEAVAKAVQAQTDRMQAETLQLRSESDEQDKMLRKQHEQQLEEMRAQLESAMQWREQVAMLQEQVSSLTTTNATLSHEVGQLKEENAALMEDLTLLRAVDATAAIADLGVTPAPGAPSAVGVNGSDIGTAVAADGTDAGVDLVATITCSQSEAVVIDVGALLSETNAKELLRHSQAAIELRRLVQEGKQPQAVRELVCVMAGRALDVTNGTSALLAAVESCPEEKRDELMKKLLYIGVNVFTNDNCTLNKKEDKMFGEDRIVKDTMNVIVTESDLLPTLVSVLWDESVSMLYASHGAAPARLDVAKRAWFWLRLLCMCDVMACVLDYNRESTLEWIRIYRAPKTTCPGTSGMVDTVPGRLCQLLHLECAAKLLLALVTAEASRPATWWSKEVDIVTPLVSLWDLEQLGTTSMQHSRTALEYGAPVLQALVSSTQHEHVCAMFVDQLEHLFVGTFGCYTIPYKDTAATTLFDEEAFVHGLKVIGDWTVIEFGGYGNAGEEGLLKATALVFSHMPVLRLLMMQPPHRSPDTVVEGESVEGALSACAHFGRVRLAIVNFVAALLMSGNEDLEVEMTQQDLWHLCFAAFFAYPRCNVLHTSMLEFVFAVIFEDEREALMQWALQDFGLLQRIMDTYSDPTQGNTAAAVCPVNGHLTQLTLLLEDDVDVDVGELVDDAAVKEAWSTHVERVRAVHCVESQRVQLPKRNPKARIVVDVHAGQKFS